MKSVLVPVDGSDCSLRAIDYLVDELARQPVPGTVQVHLLNVQPAVRGDIGQFVGHDEITAYQREESEKALAAARTRLEAAKLRPIVHCRVGHVADAIAQVADELGCDHIVMGTHGRSALAELLAGSTTIRVVHQARVPVVLVK